MYVAMYFITAHSAGVTCQKIVSKIIIQNFANPASAVNKVKKNSQTKSGYTVQIMLSP